MVFYVKTGVFSDFTFSGVTLTQDTSFTPQIGVYNLASDNVSLLSLRYKHSRSYSSFSTFTFELQIIRNNTVIATTGEKDAVKGITTDSYYYATSTSANLKLTDTYHDLSIYTLRVIIRINGSVAKTVDLLMISLPRNTSSNGYVLSLSSPSSPQTGKIGTMSIQRSTTSTSFAKVYALGSNVYAYKQTDNSFTYKTTAYVNNGLTPIDDTYLYNDYLSSFSCNYYVPYDSSISHPNNATYFGIYLFPDITPLQPYYTVTQSSVMHSSNRSAFYVYDGSIPISYVDQEDSNASPTIGSVSLTESPAGLSNTYGKYIGGGISTLTFAYNNVTYRYGATFKEVTFKLYDSSSQLIDTASSQSEANYAYRLENETDTTYYLDVEIETTIFTKGTYRYSNIQTYGYEPPNIISFNASRCNQDGSANDSGAYCKITYQFKVIPLGNHNSKEVTLVAPDGSHVYTNLDYNYGSAYQYISAADIEHSYAISITVEDDFVTVSASRNVSTAGVIMDFLYDGKGIGLGKVAETSEMVEVNPQWVFKCETMTFKGIDLQSILESLGYVFPT